MFLRPSQLYSQEGYRQPELNVWADYGVSLLPLRHLCQDTSARTMVIWKPGGTLEDSGFSHTEVEPAKVGKALELARIFPKNPVLVPALATPRLF